jgi:pimeloyl-ACP methyl ester carboxylesterase
MTQMIVPRGVRSVLSAGAAALLLAAAPALAQNPPSDNIVFLHGLLADQHSWENTANRLAQEYRFTPWRFSIPYTASEAQQAQVFANDIAPLPNNLAAIGKSNGVMVLRTYLQNPGKVNRMASVAGPNRGAPLADNVLTGNVFYFPSRLATDIADAANWYATFDTQLPVFFVYGFDAMASMFNFFASILRILSWYGLVLSSLSAYAPVSLDLSPGSGAVQTLNSATGLQRAAAAAPTRISIAAYFGVPRDMIFHTLLNGDAALLSGARWTTYAMSLVLYSHYSAFLDPSVPNYLLLRNGAYRWLNVAADMIDIDPYWLDMVGVLRGVDSQGRVLYDESDGIVPLASAVMPGNTRSFVVGPTSHQVLNDDPRVYQSLRTTISEEFRIPARMTPVNSVAVLPSPASVVVTKSTQLSARAYDVLGSPVSGRPTTWSSANSAIATVGNTGVVTGVKAGTTTVSATIDGYSGSSTVTVTSAPPGIGSLSISGPGSVRGGQNCTWNVSVSGGVAPYTYQWTRNGSPAGDGTASLTMLTPTTSFTLGVTVTDAQRSSMTTTRSVSVSSSAATCGPVGVQ